MSYLRQRPRIAPNGRVTVRLTPAQRDALIAAPGTPRSLSHALHRAHVTRGELSLRIAGAELDAFIAAAATAPAKDKKSERALAMLLRYPEGLEDRFAE